MKKISIILPVYNEAEIIKEFSDSLHAVLDQLLENYSFEVIYCVDKSTDDTESRVKEICRDRSSVYLGLSKRFGHQMSLVAGMDHCCGEAAIMMDCDLEHPPSLIPKLLELFEQGYEVVHTRRLYNEKIGYLKKTTSNFYYGILSRLSSVTIEEGSADFRLISRKCIDVFCNSIREQHQFLRGLFRWVGFEQCTCEFVSGTRHGGKSKYTARRMFSFAINGIISFSKLPLTISAVVGIIIAFVGFAYGGYTVIASLVSQRIPSGWPSTISLIAFLGGLQLTVLGIIGRYIGEVFDEVKRRPLYIVEEEYRP